MSTNCPTLAAITDWQAKNADWLQTYDAIEANRAPGVMLDQEDYSPADALNESRFAAFDRIFETEPASVEGAIAMLQLLVDEIREDGIMFPIEIGVDVFKSGPDRALSFLKRAMTNRA
jgi:hypothetical protein